MEFDWEKLIRDFKARRCIMMLGPRISGVQEDSEWIPLQEKLALNISNTLEKLSIEFDDASKRNLPYIAQRFLSYKKARRVDLEDKVREFYANFIDADARIPNTYSLLASLPVKVIINTTPDNFIENALRNAGKSPIVINYNFRLTNESIRRPNEYNLERETISIEKPLVFNLLGTTIAPHTESLVLTEIDQMEFIRNIVKDDPKVPSEILAELSDRNTYLFLGFNMESWQFRLLLDRLNLKQGTTTLSPQTDNYPLTKVTQTFFEERFNFHFIEDKIDSFIKKLDKKINQSLSTKTNKVSIIYSPKDETYLKELEKWFQLMVKNNEIEIWHKEKVLHGNVEKQLTEHLESSDIILLLISADFIADDDIFDNELELAIELKKTGQVQLIPIITRSCDWRANRDLRKLEPLPKDGIPINSNKWATIDEAYNHVIQAFKKRLN